MRSKPFKRAGFYNTELNDFDALCAKADNELFQKILNSPDRVLHSLLSLHVVQKYNFRSRPHNRHLPCRTHNSSNRLQFHNSYVISPYVLTFILFYTTVFVFVSKCVLSAISLLNDSLIDRLNFHYYVSCTHAATHTITVTHTHAGCKMIHAL